MTYSIIKKETDLMTNSRYVTVSVEGFNEKCYIKITLPISEKLELQSIDECVELLINKNK